MRGKSRNIVVFYAVKALEVLDWPTDTEFYDVALGSSPEARVARFRMNNLKKQGAWTLTAGKIAEGGISPKAEHLRT